MMKHMLSTKIVFLKDAGLHRSSQIYLTYAKTASMTPAIGVLQATILVATVAMVRIR